jgi:hypothetical protein
MNFDPNPIYPSVITKAIKVTDKEAAAIASISSQSNSPSKSSGPKYIPFEIMLPIKAPYFIHPYTPVKYTCALPQNYRYLFYKEINPPPPQC